MKIDAVLLAYVVLLSVFKIVDNMAMARGGTRFRLATKDWTYYFISVALGLVIVAPAMEYMYIAKYSTEVFWYAGGALFLAATILRMQAHFDLGKNFSPEVVIKEGQKLVDTGLYRFIRHPHYLSILLLATACPLFLAARYSWIVWGMVLVGILVRISAEERVLREQLEGYNEYMKRTSALIPKIF